MGKKNRDDADTNATSEWPSISEGDWYALAVTSAIFTLIAIAGAYGWIFGDGFDGDSDVKLAQALAPFGVALFAIVTFCATSWRGSINARQADLSEREGRTKLLQEGAKLLGERGNVSHVSAGIATLELLITGPDQRLAIQAMNLVADYVQAEMALSHAHSFRDEAFAALASGARLGREANRKVEFRSELNGVTDEGTQSWYPLAGVRQVKYVGGWIESGFDGTFEDNLKFQYSNVVIKFLDDIKLNYRFDRCHFRHCSFISINVPYDRLTLEDFFKCNFSSCDFSRRGTIPDLRGGFNFYRLGTPPHTKQLSDVDWSTHFLVIGKHEYP
jgi:hypothetical protein